MKNRALSIKKLSVSFKMNGQYYKAVDNIDLDIMENEVFAIVGESGCGKSATAMSILRLHNENYTKIEGEINFGGKDLVSISEHGLNKIKGKEIGMIFQDPLSALNPLHRIGKQIEEMFVIHTNLNSLDRKNRALELLEDVGIPNPEIAYNSFPHELSGGMRQRIIIAIALSLSPSLLIADEPTTALDVTIQAQILDLMRDLKEKSKASVILITHDLGVVAEMADRVAVMYAGQIVELANVDEIFENPKHPYTKSLLSSIPRKSKSTNRLNTIFGSVPDLMNMPRDGCRFSSRIPWINEKEHEENPKLQEIEPNHFVRCSCYKNFHFQDSSIEKVKEKE
ncbi:MAG: ABC transporter ATP-binding protein [Defluviitaleaceae bacterium]|nr:ABC transporter ATP-binding protein [Defluviitaleaceae bacterium]